MRKLLALVLAAAMLLSLAALAAAEEKTVVKFAAFPNFATINDTVGAYEEEMIAAFEAKNPDIDVQLEMLDFESGPAKIASNILGKTPPNVVFDAPGRIITWASEGILADLNGMFSDEDKADISKGVQEASKYKGDYVMYPLGTAPFTMGFNKTMLEQHGLLDMLPLAGDRTWTLEQYEALLRALKEKGEAGAVIFCKTQGGDQGTRAFLANLYGGSVMNDDLSAYTTNEEPFVKALDWTMKAIEEGLLEEGTGFDGTAAIDEFAAGRVSHTILFGTGLYNLRKAALDEMGIEAVLVPYPAPEGKAELEFLVSGLCVFKNEDEKVVEASKRFVEFVANDAEWAAKNIAQAGQFSPRASVTAVVEDPEIAYGATMSKMFGKYYNTVPGFAQMRTFWFASLQAAFSGEKTAQEAMDYFTGEANKTLVP